MMIEIKRSPEAITFEIVGRLDTSTAPSLEKTINEHISETNKIVLDLKGLEYISSAGLRVLLGAQKKMQEVGGMVLKNVSENVMEIFEITGFADILTILNIK